MNPANIKAELVESIADILETALATKGHAFAAATAGRFEALQAKHALSLIRARCGEDDPWLTRLLPMLSCMLEVISGRLVETLPTEADQTEARALADALFKRRHEALASMGRRAGA